MGVSEQAVTALTLAEFFAWEERQPERHELVGGRTYAMSGGTERHSLMAGHLAALLTPAARTNGCRTFRADRKLRVASGDVYYPDVLVVSEPVKRFETSSQDFFGVSAHRGSVPQRC